MPREVPTIENPPLDISQRLLLIANELRQVEANLPLPTQAEFDKLYQEIYTFVEKAVAESHRQNKPCLFVLAETHPVIFSKSSLLIEKMFAMVSYQFGINHIFLELTLDSFSYLYKEIIPNLEKTTAPINILEKVMPNSINCLVILANTTVVKSHFTVAPLEEDDPDYLDMLNRMRLFEVMPPQHDLIREKGMCRTLIKFNQPSLVIVGSHHFRPICRHPAIKDKFLVYPINTIKEYQIQDSKERREYDLHSIKETMTKADYNKHLRSSTKRSAYLLNKRHVKQFIVPGKLIEANTDLLLTMVDKAHEKFFSSKSIQPPIKSPTDFSKSTQVSHKIGTVPISLTLQAGFWMASKMGFCENPSQASTPILSDDSAKMSVARQQQEVAAELHFSKQGSSLEAALRQLLGKHYTESSLEEKTRWKDFLMDVVNGNVSDRLGKQFNRYAQMDELDLRVEGLTNILREHAVRDLVTSVPPQRQSCATKISTPFSAILQAGFWVASKVGLYEKPSQVVVPTLFSETSTSSAP